MGLGVHTDGEEELFTKGGEPIFMPVWRPSADNAPPYCSRSLGGGGVWGTTHCPPTCLGSRLMNGSLETVPKTCSEGIERGKEYLN